MLPLLQQIIQWWAHTGQFSKVSARARIYPNGGQNVTQRKRLIGGFYRNNLVGMRRCLVGGNWSGWQSKAECRGNQKRVGR